MTKKDIIKTAEDKFRDLVEFCKENNLGLVAVLSTNDACMEALVGTVRMNRMGLVHSMIGNYEFADLIAGSMDSFFDIIEKHPEVVNEVKSGTSMTKAPESTPSSTAGLS